MGKREHVLEAPSRRHNTIHMNHTKIAHHFLFFFILIGNQNQFIKSNARKGIPKYTRNEDCLHEDVSNDAGKKKA